MKEINALVVVAHPDDETLWAGGTILGHPTWKWTIVTLTRKSDRERASNFHKALNFFGATGKMGDLDDGPDQHPLNIDETSKYLLSLLDEHKFDLILTHHPAGEYTRHLRHEETSRAVILLWKEGKIDTQQIWFFAYEDGGKSYFPRAIREYADVENLPDDIWRKKYELITDIYRFREESWEAQTTPREESFIKISSPTEAMLLVEHDIA